MKRILLSFLTLLVLGGVIYFTVKHYSVISAERKAGEHALIVVSIYPYELLVKQIMGEQVQVKTLLPANASPHTWSPNPSDLVDLERAKIIISNGLGLETNLRKAFSQHGGKHIEIATLLSHELLGAEEHDHSHVGHSHGEHDHDGLDPHIWTSPELLLNLVNSLSGALSSAFPNMAEVIKLNTNTVIQELMAADRQIFAERQQLSKPAIVTYHNSFHYFTKRYDIEYLGYVQSSPGQEPSARDLSNLGRKIRSHGVKAIFIEPQMNPRSAEVLAREFGLQVLTIDPLGTSLGVETISEFILKNWEIMKSGL